MKADIANIGDRIKLIKKLSYGSVYGLIEIEKGKEFTVKNRNNSNDGILTVETIRLTGSSLGSKTDNVTVWDDEYEIVNSLSPIETETKEKEREVRITSVDTLIHLQRNILKDAKNLEGFTDYDFNDLNKALMVLERLKLKI